MKDNSRLLFGKSQRILRGTQFGHILRRGACAADATLVLCVVVSTEGRPSRLGITIPKKTGSAVVRNRWKRLIRESFRTQQHQLPSGYDFVIRPKKGALLSSEEIKRSVPALVKRAIQRL